MRRKSFTLVELVMVMVIIGLLAAIIAPKFTSQMEQAKAANTKANLDAIRKAVKLYYSRNGTLINTTLQDMVAEGYLSKVPVDGFLRRNTVLTGDFSVCTPAGCGMGMGGWCYDSYHQIVLPDLPDTLEPDGKSFCDY